MGNPPFYAVLQSKHFQTFLNIACCGAGTGSTDCIIFWHTNWGRNYQAWNNQARINQAWNDQARNILTKPGTTKPGTTRPENETRDWKWKVTKPEIFFVK
jgi:hypothetical protein